MAIKTRTKAMDLGQLQEEVELSTTDLKKKQREFKAAKEAQNRATERYSSAVKAMEAGYDTIRAAASLLP